MLDAVRNLLADGSALRTDQLLVALATAGVDLGDDPAATLDDALDDEDLGPTVPLADGRWVWLPGLLAGRVFTHRLTAREIAHDLLDITPDLEPVVTLTDHDPFTRLAEDPAGETLDDPSITEVFAMWDADLLAERGVPAEAVDEDGGLLLPAGYLDRLGLAAGDLVGVRVTETGFAVAPVDETALLPDSAGTVGDALRAVLDAAEGGPVEIGDAVWTVCADHPALFTGPRLPLHATIEAAELARDGEWLAPAGFDFTEWRSADRLTDLADRYGLDDDEALAVPALVLLYEQAAELVETARAAGQEPDAAGAAAAIADLPDMAREAVGWLAEPAVAEAVLDETMGTGLEGAPALELFARILEPLAPEAARAALRWLRGKALERLGRVTEAETAYQEAESLDPDWPPALIDLAHYASDRGEAARSLALLRRAGVPADEPLVELLARFDMPRSKLGRNQPCWCGSGRKYKQCHLGRELATLAERSEWLYEKAALFVLESQWQDTVGAVAQERARFADSPESLLDAVADPLVIDAVLFEGGAFADFVATRGFLLPEDERLLAEEWLTVDRSVHEVQAVRAGAGLTLRDVRTGDVHEVTAQTTSRQVAAGELICARVVPAGAEGTRQIFGGVQPVALPRRDELVALLAGEPDPTDLVAVLAGHSPR